MIVGIDLGTTNSAIGVWRDGRAQLIPNRLAQVLTPSAVGVDDDDSLLVGLAARERQSSHPELTATAFKRYMGTQRSTSLGHRTFLPEELSALVLRALVSDAEAHLGEKIAEAVITVPAYFNDKQRKATRRAGELAGLTVERLLNEPTAAALAYGIHELADETRFLVFDLGGGTFDVSVLEIFEGVIEVRATAGDNHLGGEDFNEAIVRDMRAKLFKAAGKQVIENRELTPRLRVLAERARRILTDEAVAEVQLVWRDKAYDYQITSAEFEALVTPLLARLREPVLRSLRDSEIQFELLQKIVMVGGATRMPCVRRAVTRMFGRFPETTVHPDEAVAIGAAIQAGMKARDAALKEVVLTDVCPYTLGVDSAERRPDGSIHGGIFSPVIERNTTVPVSRVKAFHTLETGQQKVLFNIYQGESRNVSGNIHLGRIEVPVPSKRAGEVMVECRFTYDINGLLEVDIRVPDTEERRQLVIVDDDDPSGINLEQRRKFLATLKVHPKDDEPNRAALARAERCFEDFIGERREHIGALMARFEQTLDSQDPRSAEISRNELHAALDALEGETYL